MVKTISLKHVTEIQLVLYCWEGMGRQASSHRTGTVCFRTMPYVVRLMAFQINEFVDARDLNMGAWFEAQIMNVTRETRTPSDGDEGKPDEDHILYHVKYEE